MKGKSIVVDAHNPKGPNYNLNRLGAKYFRRQIDKKNV